MDGEITLSPSVLGECVAAKTFRDNRQPVTSLCFDDSGELCVTSAQDESLHIYNCREGKYVPDLNLQCHDPFIDNLLIGFTDTRVLYTAKSMASI